MNAQSAVARPLNPAPTRRWWKYLAPRTNEDDARKGDTLRLPRIQCPRGHAIPTNEIINETGFVRCTTRGNVGGAGHRPGDVIDRNSACGRWIFVFAIDGDGAIVVEVALEEIPTIRRLKTAAAMIAYLGIFEQRSP